MHELPMADCIVYLGFVSQLVIIIDAASSHYTRSSQIYF